MGWLVLNKRTKKEHETDPQLDKLVLPGRMPMPGMETSTGVDRSSIISPRCQELDAKIVQGDGGEEKATTNGREETGEMGVSYFHQTG